jgi:hypothetical protein
MVKEKIPTVSVVIATLGGAQLSKTIACLNAGNIAPIEILICIPKQYFSRVSEIKGSNIRVITTTYASQVAQRAKGFSQTKGLLVMQLDDDIELEVDCLQQMVTTISIIGKKNVVGPVYLNNKTGLTLSPYPIGLRGVFISIYYGVFGGLPFGKSRMGCLSSACVSSSIDPRFFSGSVVKCQWLPGGCVLSYREDLILERFYPFDGKAYAEDGLHSYLRAKIGISHNVALKAHALIEAPTNTLSFRQFIREMYVRMKIVQMMKGNVTQKIIFIIAEFIRLLLLRIYKHQKYNQ